MNTFTVSTYYHPELHKGDVPTLHSIAAYTMYHVDGKDRVVFEIEAKNGTEAKKIASRKRLEMEKEKRK